MRRRSVLRTLLAAGGASALAGCNGLFAGSSSGTEATGATDAPPTTRATTATSTPYRAADEPLLDRPRGVRVRNLTSTDRFLTVVVSDGEWSVSGSAAVEAGGVATFADLVATQGRYRVLVETADGDRRTYEWAVRPELTDLWVDLTPGIDFRRPVLCLTDCVFAVDYDRRTLAYSVPADLDVAGALGRTPALAVDNDTERETRATVHLWHQGQLRFASRYLLPSDVRMVIPVLPANRRYGLVLRTDAGEAIYDWLPSVRTTLYASLAGGPTFRCGYAAHDLRVTNESDDARTVTVRVQTGERTLFERTFELGAGATETVPSAVEPAGPLRFAVETDDGLAERYNWVRCAPNGPVVVVVGETDASVTVRPTVAGSGE